jgi:hypothetical protein
VSRDREGMRLSGGGELYKPFKEAMSMNYEYNEVVMLL